MAALLFKVFTLTIRTAAKPLAGRFQSYVIDHPTLRPAVVNLAQKMHKTEVTITRMSEGKTNRLFVGNMSDDKALELAAKIVSEGFVFSVGVAVIAWEYERQRRNDLKKRAKEEAFRKSVDDLYLQEREKLEADNAEQLQIVMAMLSRVERLEETLHAMQEQQAQRQQSKWGIFSLQRQ